MNAVMSESDRFVGVVAHRENPSAVRTPTESQPLLCGRGSVADPRSLPFPRRRRVLGTAVFAWAMTCFAGFNVLAQTAPPDAQSITVALRGKQYKQALELARQALNTAPGDVQILTLEALAWKGLGQDQNALTAFQRALRIAPNYLAALEGAAQIEYAAGSDAAIPLLDRLLKLRPDEPTAHAMRAVMAWKQRDCPTAVAHFERSRSVMALQPDALREYGICLVRLNQREAAAAAFQQIVSRNPEDRPARYSLSSVEMMAQRYKDALDTLRPLLAASTDAQALALASTRL